ncbi:MAG TPA: hypothetical protein EYH45_05625 [Candidatus Caldiarchaeum subterraneum]|uniref:Uncharacterized protein n=1 Tax=Caldiarchaeum subterraneum TaxID=311458 RepID=A0A832ZW76_CALS0|nr:hypothetical protein [Candidatus Caldarchaeum subterraneum]
MNPIIKMLTWKTRLLGEDDIRNILTAVANIDKQPFSLTDLAELLPDELVKDSKKRRSISTLLSTLVDVGYLSKPSERKWLRNSPSLSYYLSSQIIELGNIERGTPVKKVEKRIIDVSRR